MLYFVVSFLSSVIGAICGIGGGVIIKPVLDLFGAGSAASISFLSGCTVLSMSFYSVGRSLLAGDGKVNLKTGTSLAIGAAAGGVMGKQFFHAIRSSAANPDTVGGIQSVCLAIIVLGSLIYAQNKSKIKTHTVGHTAVCLLIGLSLGVMSSFLGIGGGPINLVVLYYFFSMDTKTAAANSLYIILFSQVTSLLSTLVSRSVPEFETSTLLLMAAGGILGGILGRGINKKIDDSAVEKLFLVLTAMIVLISARNAAVFLM